MSTPGEAGRFAPAPCRAIFAAPQTPPMLFWTLCLFSGLFLLCTLLPLSRGTTWWIRGADFPRVQFSILGLAVLAAALGLLDRGRPRTWWLAGATSAGLIYQVWWIAPYTRLHPREVKGATGRRGESLSILSANVLMTNPHSDRFLRLVREANPDVLVTLETNARWERDLRSLASEYPHRLRCPLENLYGMHLYSRFPLEDARVQFLVEPEVPSMHTLVVMPSGRRIALHCLHPAPPSPTENPSSQERDAELVMVGRSVARARFPVIVSGDLNDVAWSATTRLFRKLSGLLDPRIGRGMYNTFHAGHRFFRWPVDHFFHSKHFVLSRLERLPAFGSDHFPVFLELELAPDAAGNRDAPAADGQDREEAREKLAKEDVTSRAVHRPGESPRRGERGRAHQRPGSKTGARTV